MGFDGDGGLFFLLFLMRKRLLDSEASTKRVKKDKARKVIVLEVFIVNCFLNETVRKSKQAATTASVKSDPSRRCMVQHN
jgi:hypothetical protein